MYVLLKSKQSHRAISVFSPSLPRLLCVSEHLSNFSLYFSHCTVHIHKGFLSHHQEPRRLHVQILRHQSPFPPCTLSRHHPAWEPKYGQAVHNLASSSYDDTYTQFSQKSVIVFMGYSTREVALFMKCVVKLG